MTLRNDGRNNWVNKRPHINLDNSLFNAIINCANGYRGQKSLNFFNQDKPGSYLFYIVKPNLFANKISTFPISPKQQCDTETFFKRKVFAHCKRIASRGKQRQPRHELGWGHCLRQKNVRPSDGTTTWYSLSSPRAFSHQNPTKQLFRKVFKSCWNLRGSRRILTPNHLCPGGLIK